MQNESIFINENFLKNINAQYEELYYNDKRYVYRIKRKEMHIISTLCKELKISDGLVKYIFQKFPIDKIVFSGTYDNYANIGKCVIRKFVDDNVLFLEDYANVDEYISSLGKKTRQHLRNYQRVLERDIKENDDKLTIDVYSGKESVAEFYKICEEIFELNRKRCEAKGFSATVHEEYVPAYRDMGGVCSI